MALTTAFEKGAVAGGEAILMARRIVALNMQDASIFEGPDLVADLTVDPCGDRGNVAC